VSIPVSHVTHLPKATRPRDDRYGAFLRDEGFIYPTGEAFDAQDAKLLAVDRGNRADDVSLWEPAKPFGRDSECKCAAVPDSELLCAIDGHGHLLPALPELRLDVLRRHFCRPLLTLSDVGADGFALALAVGRLKVGMSPSP
jgi:hypothetical protein